MKTMFLAQVNWVLLQILLSSASGLESHGGGDTQDDQEDGGALVFDLHAQGGQDGPEGVLQQDRGGQKDVVLDLHLEDGQDAQEGGGEWLVQLDPPGRGEGAGQDCGGPGRQWGVWGGR